MAFKKYAYYNKGNKIAIIQRESRGSAGNLAVAHCTIGGYDTKDTCEAAGGQWIPSSSSNFGDSYEKYVSPTSSVASGVELEYSYSPVSNLIDENSELDISRYQSLAVVYYLKAKMSEDARELDQREYYLREFRRQIEKNAAAKKHGPTIIQGFRMMRK